ncbi:AbrB/MazE/SpoVT family DNA-binding domain-containing protein [bacterium]|nr:AbrB/MazE/SpoVT family DNA-binding domain-containing protein [bacterium]
MAKQSKVLAKIVTLSEKGQLVIPKVIQEKMGLKTGEQMIVMAQSKGFLMVAPLRLAEKWLLKVLAGISAFKKIIKENGKDN